MLRAVMSTQSRVRLRVGARAASRTGVGDHDSHAGLWRQPAVPAGDRSRGAGHARPVVRPVPLRPDQSVHGGSGPVARRQSKLPQSERHGVVCRQHAALQGRPSRRRPRRQRRRHRSERLRDGRWRGRLRAAGRASRRSQHHRHGRWRSACGCRSGSSHAIRSCDDAESSRPRSCQRVRVRLAPFVLVAAVSGSSRLATPGAAKTNVGRGKCVDCHDHKDEKEWSQTRDGDGKGKQHFNALNQLNDPKAPALGQGDRRRRSVRRQEHLREVSRHRGPRIGGRRRHV